MYKELNGATAKPKLWNCYTADKLWTDAYIAKQMLSFHLNPEINAASRSFDFINRSVTWMIEEFKLGEESKVIDFGCGPGLYTHRFKQRGIGKVVGVDFSQSSLGYAKEQAQKEALAIEYHLANYLDFESDNKYDLITLVMCDFCALSPLQRGHLLKKFKSMLEPNGIIVLDVFTASRFEGLQENITLEKDYMGGFWSANDYWCIHTSHGYADEKVWLDKFEVIEKGKQWAVYNWLQHFSQESLRTEIESHGFTIESFYKDLCGTPHGDADEMAVVIKES
ncbi:class I SAM-dependent methyltransferase [Alteromonas sediminis]|uniref:Class I SAM-dependent methyltransferase n=1 Tax=Alteromonas sediminis TaxID=2259342 RepID=A0A3N5YEL0_9ALTE|nr:class I SAM-dependent methyltransferase [Alteromonas sediminis]RPJ68215.1 class I SAM-dependent methyltransferase [Alteromonas sediminis]